MYSLGGLVYSLGLPCVQSRPALCTVYASLVYSLGGLVYSLGLPCVQSRPALCTV